MPPGVLPEPTIPDGERRLQALQQGGFSPQDIATYRQQRTAALLEGGFKQDEIAGYWGDKPPQSPTVTNAANGNVVMAALKTAGSQISEAFGQGVEKVRQDLAYDPLHPQAVHDTLAIPKALWDTASLPGSLLAPVIDPAVGAYAKLPLQKWTANGPVPETAAERQATAAQAVGVALLGIGEKPGVPAPVVGRSAAAVAFERGELRDPGLAPQALTGQSPSPATAARFPGEADYYNAITKLGILTPEGIKRTASNMLDVWKRTGIPPAEQAKMASANPILRQQLLAQDVHGDPAAPGFNDAATASPHEHFTAGSATAVAKGSAEDRPEARLPTFVNSVETSMGIMRQLEGSGDQAVSQAGAIGRYQIMPGTARQYGFDPARLKDPAYNEQVARAIIGDLYRKFGGNMEAMAIAYNDGPSRAHQWLAAGPGTRLEAVRDNSLRSGWRYEKVPAARDESFMPMETQQYVARARFKMGSPEGEAPAEAAQPKRFPDWKTDSVPSSLAENEAREAVGGGSLSAANAWEHAGPEDVTKEILSNLGEQPTSELGGNFNALDRAMADYISVLHPFGKLDDVLLDEKSPVLDPEKDMSIRDAFQQVNGASSRVSSFIRDGIVQHNNFDYRIIPDSPSLTTAAGKALKAGNRDEWVASMLARRTNNRATKFIDEARTRLVAAMDAQERALEEGEKTKAAAAVKRAQASFDQAVKKKGVDTGFNPFASKRVDTDPYWRRYDDATETYQTVKAGVLQYAVDTQRLAPATRNSMLRTDPIHISMQRVGLDSKDTGFKQLKGSDRKVVSDPIAADVSNWNWIIRESDRAAAVNHLLDSAAKNPDIMAKFGLRKVEETPPDTEAVDHALKQFGFSDEQMDEARDAFGAVVQDKMDERLKPNQFARYVKGKREVWQAGDELLAKAIRGVGTKIEAEALVNAANMAADMERMAITAGPDWGWVFGSIHQLSQFINDEMHPIPGVTVLRGWTHMLLGDEIAKSTRAGGAVNASMADLKGDYLEHLMADLEQTGVTRFAAAKERIKDLWSDESSAPARWNTVMWPAQFSRLMTEMIDEGNRTGLVAQGRKAGLTVGQAGARARRTGLDFQDRGMSQIGRLLTRASPMFTGYIKGSERWAEAIKNRPVSTTAVAGLLGMAVFINYGLNVLEDKGKKPEDPSRWDQVPRYDKDRYLITPEVNGARIHMRLPPGPEGFLFGGLQQRFLDMLRSHDPHAFDGALENFFSENFRLPVPAVVNAPTEAITNHSFFTGHPIIPRSVQDLAPMEQVAPYTTSGAKAIARALDPLLGSVGASGMQFSPMQLDHIVQGWTGAYGIAALNEIGGKPRPGPPTDITTIPGISRIWERNPGVNAQSIGDFYTDKQPFDQAFAERIAARREARGAAYAEWLSHGAMGTPPPGQNGLVDADLYKEAVDDARWAKADQRLNKDSAALGILRDAIWSMYGSNQSDDIKRLRVTQMVTQMVAISETASAAMRQFNAKNDR